MLLHKAITRINTSILVRNWSGGSEYITILCYRWDSHSCFFQTNWRIVCVFSVIDMPDISEGAKLRGIWVFLMIKHQFVFIHTQCVSNFEMHFGLISESNREANTQQTATCWWQAHSLPQLLLFGSFSHITQ